MVKAILYTIFAALISSVLAKTFTISPETGAVMLQTAGGPEYRAIQAYSAQMIKK